MNSVRTMLDLSFFRLDALALSVIATATWLAGCIGVNPAGDAGDVSPPIFWLVGTSMGMSPPIFGVAM